MILIHRPFWEQVINNAWKKRTIIWLMGVRRVGKTSLCQSLSDVEYFDCDLPSVRLQMQDPESFLQSKRGKKLVLDEIHRLDNPSELLKIAADHYKDVSIIATGSSTLGATKKFKDTLTGRKIEIWLTPLLIEEMELFKNNDIRHRFLFGGLPSFFEESVFPRQFFQEWIDAYWAKDIQDIFSVGKRNAFQKFTELLLASSGGLFEATRYALLCEVNRATIDNYLNVLEETFVVHVIRPYASHKPNEIVKAPKVYGFDTGIVNHAKGCTQLREDDLGFMWKHCVLNQLHAHLQTRSINYWRNKTGSEIDFVIRGNNENAVHAIECKFSILSDATAPKSIAKNFEAFRGNYPHGKNYVVAYNIDVPFTRNYGDLSITFVDAKTLVQLLQNEVH
jgi:predicted AAA+ superfamily ATPase